MASWVIHLVIPVLLALAFLPQQRRRVLLLAPFTLLPDGDWLLPFLHRGPTHSLLGPLWLAAIALAVARTRGETPWTWSGRVGAWWLAALFWASHILFDLFLGGVQALWPLTPHSYYVWVALWVETATNRMHWDIEWGIVRDGVPTVSERYAWIGYSDSAILVLILLTALAVGAVQGRLWWRAREKRPDQKQ